MLKDEILLTLSSNPKEFTSGEDISDKLGISRAAVWKYIKTLREEGYVIESYSRKGYKLISSPNIFSVEALKSSLVNNSLIKEILHYNTIDSTNDFCKNSSDTLKDGTLVLAETQTQGRGRFNRPWFSPKGTGIFCSIFLKPKLSPYDISKITSIICASIAKTLIDMNIPISVKWPNDIYLDGKKLGGILTEMKCDMDEINYLIIGFGLNINQSKEDFPEDIDKIALSLKSYFNHDFSREDILVSILNNFEYFYKALLNNSESKEAFQIIKDNSYVLNKEVIILKGKESVAGKVVDLGENGELLLDINGKIEQIYSGEVSLRIKI